MDTQSILLAVGQVIVTVLALWKLWSIRIDALDKKIDDAIKRIDKNAERMDRHLEHHAKVE